MYERTYAKSLKDASPELREDARRDLGHNQEFYVGTDPEYVSLDGRLVPLGDGKFQIVNDTEYVEQLELAVLKSWEREDDDSYYHLCQLCERDFGTLRRITHTPDCIVPALLEKYPT